jgi:hypothetical protein
MTQKHIHKYMRVKYGSKGYIIYKCTLPGCTHFVNERLILGRNAICWLCGNEFTIRILHKKPHCDECIRPNRLTKELAQETLLEALQKIAGVKE